MGKEKARWGEEELPGFGLSQIEEFLDYRIQFVDGIMNEKFTPEYKALIEKQKQEIRIKSEKEIENFNKKMIPMLAIIAGIIVILVIIEKMSHIKKRRK